MKLQIYLFIFLISLNASVAANDSIARIAAGGLVLEQSDSIEMVSERLEIAISEVSVSYVFRNHSNNDVDEMIAFPLPLKEIDLGISPRTYFDSNSFYVRVNGVLIETVMRRSALLNGVDVTENLREIGLPESMIFDFEECEYEGDDLSGFICDVSEKQYEDLKLIGIDNYKMWKVQETVLWQQLFMANSDLSVDHVYVPGVGGYVYYSNKRAINEKSSKDKRSSFSDYKNEACIDESTYKAIEARINSLHREGADVVGVLVSDVEYILGTGRNWRGSIGDFRLRVTKQFPEIVVSLCFPGKPRKIGSLSYEFHQKDYVPQDSVIVKFFSFNAM